MEGEWLWTSVCSLSADALRHRFTMSELCAHYGVRGRLALRLQAASGSYPELPVLQFRLHSQDAAPATLTPRIAIGSLSEMSPGTPRFKSCLAHFCSSIAAGNPASASAR